MPNRYHGTIISPLSLSLPLSRTRDNAAVGHLTDRQIWLMLAYVWALYRLVIRFYAFLRCMRPSNVAEENAMERVFEEHFSQYLALLKLRPDNVGDD